MRETRTSGSEGGGAETTRSPYPYQGLATGEFVDMNDALLSSGRVGVVGRRTACSWVPAFPGTTDNSMNFMMIWSYARTSAAATGGASMTERTRIRGGAMKRAEFLTSNLSFLMS